MTATSTVDGLVSGLNTTQLISQLMQVEGQPQALLKTKVSDANTLISGLQGVNTNLAAVATAGSALSTAVSWQTTTASSNIASVTVTAAPGATTGSLNFHVNKIASAQTDVSASHALTDTAAFPTAQFTITGSAGTASATPASGSLTDVVAAINSISTQTGVKAQPVQVSPGVYRLQVLATSTGSAGAYSFDAGFTAAAGLQRISDPVDASVHIGATAGGYDVTSPTNTFTDVVPGLTFSVSQENVDATVSVASDPNSLADQVQKFVTAANSSLNLMTTTGAPDATGKANNPLAGNSDLRRITQSMTEAVDGGSTTTSSSQAGLSVARDGTITFDRTAFLAAYASDPTTTVNVAKGVVDRITAVATAASSATGTLSTVIAGTQTEVTDLTTQISAWDVRLADKQTAYQAIYTNLETSLSTLQSQSSWLSSQLNSLSSSSTAKA